MNQGFTRCLSSVCVAAVAIPVALVAEMQPSAGPFSGVAVPGAPFSATAITSVRQTLASGENVEQTTTARYYRDGAGRVRVEQDIPSPEGSARSAAPRITLWPDVEKGRVYTLDPATHAASPGPLSAADWAVGGGETFALPRGGSEFLIFHRAQHRRAHGGLGPDTTQTEELLGTRAIEGVETVGRRITIIVPVGRFGNTSAISIVDDRWESPTLKLLVSSHYTDPSRGVIDYSLRNIQLSEPAADLFDIPREYTITAPSDMWLHMKFADNTAKTASGK